MRHLGALIVAGLLAGSQGAHAQPPSGPRVPPYLPIPAGAAVIMDTGSTNSIGYRIVIQPEGSLEYVAGEQRATASVSADLARAFFSHLTDAAPLDRLPSTLCMKSVSFGSSLYVWWWAHGRSPDLLCPTNVRGAALRDDAQQIAHELSLTRDAPVMRPLMPGEQRKPLPTLSP
ncbi:MAG: hypothetical protein JOY87_10675 [Candidatus Eremiobacteraeota bacterium]|nr:hypothetical protein [Candidatus Eremiobacteraeota bacterium]